MTDAAYKVWEAFKAELIVEPTDDMKEALASAIREVANCFEYDSYGLASLNADDFNQIADELEKLPMITDEQILELATYHFYDDGGHEWSGTDEGILNFARAIYKIGYDKGHDGGWEDRGIAESSTYPSGLVEEGGELKEWAARRV